MEGERVGKGKGGLDLDICRRAPEFLVTPLVTQTDTGPSLVPALTLASRAGKKRAYSRVSVRMCASTSNSWSRRLELCETHTNRPTHQSPQHSHTAPLLVCSSHYVTTLWRHNNVSLLKDKGSPYTRLPSVWFQR